jgi:hypothetical protein
LEVLISTGILSVGLLCMALLIPAGRFAAMEATKSDRSGACGRAALREIKVRRLLNYVNWYPTCAAATVNVPPIAIDPLGYAKGLTGNLGGGAIARYTFQDSSGNPLSLAAAEPFFRWQDDKSFELPSDASLRPLGQFVYPSGNLGNAPVDAGGNAGTLKIDANYSWFFTVTPAPEEATLQLRYKTRFFVSAAVCFQRDFSATGETAGQLSQLSPLPLNTPATSAFPTTHPTLWTGTIQLTTPIDNLKANQWVILCGVNTTAAPPVKAMQWYRVVSANTITDSSGNTSQWITLAGPDIYVENYWYQDTVNPANTITPYLVVIDGVLGVYSTTIDVNPAAMWGDMN